MNVRERKMQTIVAGICTLSICLSLIYPLETQAAEDISVQVENTDAQQAEEEKDSPIMDPDLEDVIPENEKTEALPAQNQEADESVSGDQKVEVTIPEEQTDEKLSQEKPEQRTNEINTDKQNQESVDTDQKAVQWDFTEEYDLTLQYDDRYSLDTVKTGWKIASIKTEEVLSNRVTAGKNTGERDADVILCDEQSDTDIIAVGVGKAEVLMVPGDKLELAQAVLEDSEKAQNADESIKAIEINVTVEPAKLTLMYVAGQSNAEGYCSSDSGYRLSDSIACVEGEVYSTYAPTSSKANSIAGLSFSKLCKANNAVDFVAGSLGGNESISGNSLEYKLNALTRNGLGKTGPDSGLAYEWNRLTGDKVWVVNTAWGGTSIDTWIPEESSYIKYKMQVWNKQIL